MAKKIKRRKKSRPSFLKSTRSSQKQPPETVRIVNYNITFEPLERADYPDEVEEQYAELHKMARENPPEAIICLKALKEKYPKVPILSNWLFVALSMDNQPEEAYAVAKEGYEKHPDYLFAKLNYAELCMRRGKLDEVPIIFDNKFELTMHYPERDTFHITEVVGFFTITGIYHAATGNIEPAKVCLQLLQDIAPDNPATSQLALTLAPWLLTDLL